MIYFNARSVLNKLSDIDIVANMYSPTLILICETWLTSNITNSMLHINGYEINNDIRIDKNGATNGIGSGLLVYQKCGFITRRIAIDSNFVQFVAFTLLVNNDATNGVSFVLYYRSPNSSIQNTDNFYALLKQLNHSTLLVGDLNMPFIDWTNFLSDRRGDQMLDVVDECGLSQLIDFPTHLGGNILDAAFTRTPGRIKNITDIGNIGTSDHTAILFEIGFQSRSNDSCELIREWHKGDKNGLFRHYMDINWADLRSSEDPWAVFENKIKVGLDMFIPMNYRRAVKKPPWFNYNVTRACQSKSVKFKRYLATKTSIDFRHYKQAEKSCKRIVRKAKRAFEIKIANSSNKRQFVAYVKSKNKTKESIGPLLHNNVLHSDPSDMCNIFNEFFSSVFTREPAGILPEITERSKGASLLDCNLNEKLRC